MPKPTPPAQAKSLPGKSTGPVTVAGKRSSSLNALRHGATSGRWLSDAERASYMLMLKELGDYYESDNPLVAMQIERIAKLRVQLQRVQEVMDAAFHIERRRRPGLKGHTPLRDLSGAELDDVHRLADLALQTGGGESVWEESVVRGALAELMSLPSTFHPAVALDIVSVVPMACSYLFAQARSQGRSMVQLLGEYRAEPDPGPGDLRGLGLGGPGEDSEGTSAVVCVPCVVAQFSGVDPRQLMSALGGLRVRLLHRSWRYDRYNSVAELIEPYEMATVPDMEQLDRLMRYQTTINRQLSSAVGELLAIIEAPAPRRPPGAD